METPESRGRIERVPLIKHHNNPDVIPIISVSAALHELLSNSWSELFWDVTLYIPDVITVHILLRAAMNDPMS